MQILHFVMRGEFITLDRLLKATGLAPSGGAAKQMVAEGRVQVDGRDELRKTAKLRVGQVVSLTGARISLMPAEIDGEIEPAADPESAAVDAVAVATPPATDSG